MWHMILHLSAWQVKLHLMLGDVEAASRWAKADPTVLKRALPKNLPLYLHEVRRLSLARVELARGRPETALATLDGLTAQAKATGRNAHALEAWLLAALAWEAHGQPDAALASMEQALGEAEPEGYVRLFVEAGADVIPLLQRAARTGSRPEYARKLLVDCGQVERPPSPQPTTAQRLTEPLTPRELEVLDLICQGLPNREIAERLTVTLNTVKKHSSHIYGKLGVASRTQAILRARELGLC
jgi:LuxR family maltose regulon positive regulatory protein